MASHCADLARGGGSAHFGRASLPWLHVPNNAGILVEEECHFRKCSHLCDRASGNVISSGVSSRVDDGGSLFPQSFGDSGDDSACPLQSGYCLAGLGGVNALALIF